MDVHVDVTTVVVTLFFRSRRHRECRWLGDLSFCLVQLAAVVEDFQTARLRSTVLHPPQCGLCSGTQRRVMFLLVKLIEHDVPDSKVAGVHLDTPRNVPLARGLGATGTSEGPNLLWHIASARHVFSARALI